MTLTFIITGRRTSDHSNLNIYILNLGFLDVQLEVGTETACSAKEDEDAILTAIPFLRSFVSGEPPRLTVSELTKLTSLPRTLMQAIRSGIPQLDPANRDELKPAYLAFKTGKLPGTFPALPYISILH